MQTRLSACWDSFKQCGKATAQFGKTALVHTVAGTTFLGFGLRSLFGALKFVAYVNHEQHKTLKEQEQNPYAIALGATFAVLTIGSVIYSRWPRIRDQLLSKNPAPKKEHHKPKTTSGKAIACTLKAVSVGNMLFLSNISTYNGSTTGYEMFINPDSANHDEDPYKLGLALWVTGCTTVIYVIYNLWHNAFPNADEYGYAFETVTTTENREPKSKAIKYITIAASLPNLGGAFFLGDYGTRVGFPKVLGLKYITGDALYDTGKALGGFSFLSSITQSVPATYNGLYNRFVRKTKLQFIDDDARRHYRISLFFAGGDALGAMLFGVASSANVLPEIFSPIVKSNPYSLGIVIASSLTSASSFLLTFMFHRDNLIRNFSKEVEEIKAITITITEDPKARLLRASTPIATPSMLKREDPLPIFSNDPFGGDYLSGYRPQIRTLSRIGIEKPKNARTSSDWMNYDSPHPLPSSVKLPTSATNPFYKVITIPSLPIHTSDAWEYEAIPARSDTPSEEHKDAPKSQPSSRAQSAQGHRESERDRIIAIGRTESGTSAFQRYALLAPRPATPAAPLIQEGQRSRTTSTFR